MRATQLDEDKCLRISTSTFAVSISSAFINLFTTKRIPSLETISDTSANAPLCIGMSACVDASSDCAMCYARGSMIQKNSNKIVFVIVLVDALKVNAVLNTLDLTANGICNDFVFCDGNTREKTSSMSISTFNYFFGFQKSFL